MEGGERADDGGWCGDEPAVGEAVDEAGEREGGGVAYQRGEGGEKGEGEEEHEGEGVGSVDLLASGLARSFRMSPAVALHAPGREKRVSTHFIHSFTGTIPFNSSSL